MPAPSAIPGSRHRLPIPSSTTCHLRQTPVRTKPSKTRTAAPSPGVRGDLSEAWGRGPPLLDASTRPMTSSSPPPLCSAHKSCAASTSWPRALPTASPPFPPSTPGVLSHSHPRSPYSFPAQTLLGASQAGAARGPHSTYPFSVVSRKSWWARGTRVTLGSQRGQCQPFWGRSCMALPRPPFLSL